jgi:uncharacterized membrane protein YdjX (TVP38/TMEM64 family)
LSACGKWGRELASGCIRLLSNRRFWLTALALGIIVAIHASGLPGSLTLDTLRAHRHDIVSFVSENYPLAAIGYVAVYTLAVALSLPSALLLTLTGGFLFGAPIGTALTLIGATSGATLLFLFARSMMGENAMAHFGPSGVRLACALQANAWSYLLVLRLLPLFPFFLVNVIPALAGVRLRTFVITTFIGIIPATAIFSLSGAGLGGVLDQGSSISVQSILTPEITAALAGLALLTLAAIPLRRKFGQEAGRSAESAAPQAKRARSTPNRRS